MTFELNNTAGSETNVWDQEAKTYDASRQTDSVYHSCIRHATYGVPNGTNCCLDAGCGTGLSTNDLNAKCNLVLAVDYSLESLRILKAKGFQNVIAVQANLTSLPFKNSVFDACVCANTLQHFRPDGPQEHAVAELQRVTKEKGILSVSVHHYSRSKRRAGWVKEGKPGQAGIDYIFRFSRNDLKKIMPGSSIKGIGYYGFQRVPYFGSRLQNLLARTLGKVAGLLGYGHMLIAVTKNEPNMTMKGAEPN